MPQMNMTLNARSSGIDDIKNMKKSSIGEGGARD